MSETLKHTRYGRNSVRFTLIELLVVVAIIGILAAMLLPVLSMSKRRAVRIVDLNNRRQSSMALILYTSDFSNWYPLHTASNGEAVSAVGIAYGLKPQLVPQIRDYVNDFQIWQCLGLPDLALIDDPGNRRSLRYSNIMYYANREHPDFYLGEPTPNRTTHKNSKASMPLLSCKVRDHTAIGRGVWTGHDETRTGFTIHYPSDNPSYAYYKSPGMQFVEGACVAFMDGHAAWVPGKQLEVVGFDSRENDPAVKPWAVLPD